MKKIIITILLASVTWSCAVTKDKKDIQATEKIETREVRKGDTVTYVVPNIIYKDTVITTTSKQGTVLKTYYNSSGQISKADCIGAEIELLRSEMRTYTDNSKTKESTPDWYIYVLIGVVVIVLLKR